MIDDYDEPEEPDLEEDPTAGEVVAPVFPTTEPTTTDETEPTGEESTTRINRCHRSSRLKSQHSQMTVTCTAL